MYKIVVFVIVFLFLNGVLGGDVKAQLLEENRNGVAEKLLEEYGEVSKSFGLLSANNDEVFTTVLELFVAKDGSSWTIIAIRSSGAVAIIASGVAWIDRVKPLKKKIRGLGV